MSGLFCLGAQWHPLDLRSIGLLAAAALPAYRLITLRSRAASVVNDLRTFSTVFIAYSIQNGRWPDDGTPQVVPPQVTGQLLDGDGRGPVHG